MLVDYFLKKAGKELKKKVTSVNDELMSMLCRYDYPGNVRELKNIIERMVVISEKEVIAMEDIRQYDVFKMAAANTSYGSLKNVRSHAERSHIMYTLAGCGYDIEKAAERLQITSRQLYNKINEYNIPRR